MATIDSYIRGVDSIQLELTLIDADTLLPIDITTLDDVSVEIIKSDKAIPNNTVYWTGTILTGEVITLVAASGTLACYIDPSIHALWPICTKYFARIITTVTDTNFTSGIKTTHSIVEAFKLIKE